MKRRLATLSAVLAIAAAFGASPNAGTMSDEMLRNTFSVFSLTEAQDRSLDAIIGHFPDLRQDATTARIEFDQAFGPAIKAVDEFLTKNSSSDFDWPTLK